MEHLRDDDKDAVEDMSTNKMSIDSASDVCCDDLETGVDGTKVVWNDQVFCFRVRDALPLILVDKFRKIFRFPKKNEKKQNFGNFGIF